MLRNITIKLLVSAVLTGPAFTTHLIASDHIEDDAQALPAPSFVVTPQTRIVNSIRLGTETLHGFAYGNGPRQWRDPLNGMDIWTVETPLNKFGVNSSGRTPLGVDLSWTAPFGPLKIDYAVPVKKQKFDQP